MSTSLRQGDVASVLAIIRYADDGRLMARISGVSGDVDIEIDPARMRVVRRSVHVGDEVVYEGTPGWRVLVAPEEGVFVIRPQGAKAGDATSYRVAVVGDLRHPEDAENKDAAVTPIGQTVATPAVAAVAAEEPVVLPPEVPVATAETDQNDADADDQSGARPSTGPSLPVEEGDENDGITRLVDQALSARANPTERRRLDISERMESVMGTGRLGSSIMDEGSVEVLENPIRDPDDELVLKKDDRVD